MQELTRKEMFLRTNNILRRTNEVLRRSNLRRDFSQEESKECIRELSLSINELVSLIVNTMEPIVTEREKKRIDLWKEEHGYYEYPDF